MKIVILITVIESSVFMLAITYYYYRRGQLGKRASAIRHLPWPISDHTQVKGGYNK